MEGRLVCNAAPQNRLHGLDLGVELLEGRQECVP